MGSWLRIAASSWRSSGSGSTPSSSAKHPAGVSDRTQRVGLAARPVERQCQLGPQPFPERVVGTAPVSAASDSAC